MRKPVLAVLVAGSAFALTAAAAGAITVTGPFNPRAGTGAVQQCDPGATTVSTNESGTDVTGFTVTTTNDTSAAAQANCAGKYLWVKVSYNDGAAKAAYVRVTANADYTSGISKDMTAMSSTVALAATPTFDLGNLPTATNAIGASAILVTAQGTATGF